MALARVNRLSFSYPGATVAALREVSLELKRGEIVLLLGRSGSGKSTLLRALSGLVPQFHGGRFSGSVNVAGYDTRNTAPAALAGSVATLFQDPEDQIVFEAAASEVAFGPENLGASAERAGELAREALAAVGAGHLIDRKTRDLSGGELQRICLASALALEPGLLLLDEPTSQLDPEGAADFLALVERLARERGTAVVLSEQRPLLPFEICDRILLLRSGGLVLDAPRDEALARLKELEPLFVDALEPALRGVGRTGEIVCKIEALAHSYRPGPPVFEDISLELRRGEIVGLAGPNGCGKTTLAKLACGLLDVQAGTVKLSGRAGYLSQDPGRYVVCERADQEVALGVGGDLELARNWLRTLGLAGKEDRHPRDLSSGERERLGLAAVLATDPDLLVLDEPTRGVDPARKRELAKLFRDHSGGRATLLITHDSQFANAVCDRVVNMVAQREPARV